MTTPRFLILPGVCVNVDDIVAIVENESVIYQSPKSVCIHLRSTSTVLYVADMPLAVVLGELREAMKGPELPQMAPHVPIDIAQQARETKAAGEDDESDGPYVSPTEKHTPEPWHWEDGPEPASLEDGYVTILGPDNHGHAHITVTPGTINGTRSTAEANAARIVKCVNACAGMNDPVESLLNLRIALAAAEAECAAARKTLVRTNPGADAQRWGQFVTETVGNDATRARLGLPKIGEAK